MKKAFIRLLFGLIGKEEIVKDIERELEVFGKIDLRSEIIPFDFTSYYEKEMGKELKRRWISVKRIISEDVLKEIKLMTMEIEDRYRVEGRRMVNIDPGGVSDTRVILSTTKNYAHRIYLGKGIFCEVTLIYRKKIGWEVLPWTYPDYRTPFAHSFFEKVRERYLKERRYIKEERGGEKFAPPL